MRGAGWGHGIGLSQWGTYGFAKQGVGYRDILDHYYRDTKIVTRDGGVVRVLLQPNRSTVYLRNATQAGDRVLDEDSVYKLTRTGDQVILRSASGRKLGTFDGMVRAVGGRHVRVLGRAGNGVRDGLYRGSIEIRIAAGSGLNAINTLAMEDYLLGVVPSESPPLAGRRTPGAGGRRALLRARLERERQGLRPVRRHAQPGVPRLPRRDALHDLGRRSHRRARSSPTPATS